MHITLSSEFFRGNPFLSKQSRFPGIFKKLLVVTNLGLLCSSLFASELQEVKATLEQELSLLRQRLECLEGKLSQYPRETKGTGDVLQVGKGKGRVFSAFDVELYGYIKGDVSCDTHATDEQNQPSIALPKSAENNVSHFNATAKETRLGLNISGPILVDGRISGNTEIDFYRSTESQGSLPARLRTAFISWTYNDWTVVAGQTASDLMAPVSPSTLNFNALGNDGALGFLRMQCYVNKDTPFEKNKTLSTAVGIARPNGTAPTPHVQYCLGYKTILLTEKTSAFYCSGVFGKDKNSIENAASPNFSVWAVMGTAVVPLAKWLSLTANIWTGQNLGAYYGCASQSCNTDDPSHPHSVKAIGGWTQITLYPTHKLTINNGIGVDKPQSGLSSYDPNTLTTCISRNLVLFSNFTYGFTSALTAGLEYSFLQTSFKDYCSSHSHRLQMSVLFKF